eukprot:2956862-Rhodomonas_salina.2
MSARAREGCGEMFRSEVVRSCGIQMPSVPTLALSLLCPLLSLWSAIDDRPFVSQHAGLPDCRAGSEGLRSSLPFPLLSLRMVWALLTAITSGPAHYATCELSKARKS